MYHIKRKREHYIRTQTTLQCSELSRGGIDLHTAATHLKHSHSRKPNIPARINGVKQDSFRDEKKSAFSRETRWNFGFNNMSRHREALERSSPLKKKTKTRPKTSIECTRDIIFQEWDTFRSLTYSRDAQPKSMHKLKSHGKSFVVRRNAYSDRRQRKQLYTNADKKVCSRRRVEKLFPTSDQPISLDEYDFPSTESKAAFSVYDGNNKSDIRGSFFRKNRYIQNLHSKAS